MNFKATPSPVYAVGMTKDYCRPKLAQIQLKHIQMFNDDKP